MEILILYLATAFVAAPKNFMLRISARPDIHVQLDGFIERNSKLLPLATSTVLNPGEFVNWSISGENSGTASVLHWGSDIVGAVVPLVSDCCSEA